MSTFLTTIHTIMNMEYLIPFAIAAGLLVFVSLTKRTSVIEDDFGKAFVGLCLIGALVLFSGAI